ncbi:hypothetical protein M9H77_19424 [Catharanthus roseus]|uniref:Uncharacterized protein n=1 Tax=Catharanthus roseus TaxID=4058 RepID=A0ACC0BAA7_CATRO|nr:hypothetical protein M9H77_19424 [Catharanthus roseus]
MKSIECNGSLLLYPFLLLIVISSQYIPFSPFSPAFSIHNNQINRRSNISRIEESLGRARAAIRTASQTHRFVSLKNQSFIPRGLIYKNPYAFHQSHIEMEKRFKIWVYKEGEPPLFHNGPSKQIYSIEGQFIGELEDEDSPFIAHNPDEALAFFLPISVAKIVQNLYPTGYYHRDRLQRVFTDYVYVLSNKYQYWNRSSGADHFFVGCHDWAPFVSQANLKLFGNMIRVLCNANTSEGFQPSRDVSLVEINIPYNSLGPPLLDQSQLPPPINRSILAFFAGGPHGIVRETLFEYWKEKDKDIQVHEYLSKDTNNHSTYFEIMRKTKYCLCPSGYEVASPRVVESIYSGCVPVIISDGYVLPFSEVLDWEQFSVYIPVAKIPKIKEILEGISIDEYLKKQNLVMEVQRHFVLHRPAQPFDLLYMILHSVWLRRLNIRISF